MARQSAKSLTITLPAEMAEELNRLSRREHRSRSSLLRDAFRRYAAGVEVREIPYVDPEPGELEALERGRQQTACGDYVALEHLHDELVRNRRPRSGKKSPPLSK